MHTLCRADHHAVRATCSWVRSRTAYPHTVGVPQAQIDAAAGHVSDGGGTGKNYTHLRPEYLKGFVAAVEAYWSEMDGLTRVHRSQVGPKVHDLAERKNMK